MGDGGWLGLKQRRKGEDRAAWNSDDAVALLLRFEIKSSFLRGVLSWRLAINFFAFGITATVDSSHLAGSETGEAGDRGGQIHHCHY